jgi:hypothetical protein
VRVNGEDLGPVGRRREVRLCRDGVYDIDIVLDGTIVLTRRYTRCDVAPYLLPGGVEVLTAP